MLLAATPYRDRHARQRQHECRHDQQRQPAGRQAQAGADQPGQPRRGGRPEHAAEQRARDGGDDRHGEEREHQRTLDVGAIGRAGAGRGRFGWRQHLAGQRGQNLLDAGLQPAEEVALAEVRHDGALDDAAGQQVRQRAFHRLRGGDAHAAVVLGHHQQHAVPDVAPADLPRIADALRVVGDVFRRGGRHQQHHHLAAALALERRQPRLQRRALLGGQGAGQVHHAGGQRRHRLQGLRERRRCPRQQQHQPDPRPPREAAAAVPARTLTRGHAGHGARGSGGGRHARAPQRPGVAGNSTFGGCASVASSAGAKPGLGA
ncbi:hypothetical protein Tfont_01922 [Tepidimonas fonticaldi]|uniref:Uncharacterized protein n=1 Tax=Tepidimonas fonticaldi TaxID=1101373 RepID=A0A554XL92_9BURK|nr:hypothetical protein Tfont_01922 [Tepidimonas fonticaldi]